MSGHSQHSNQADPATSIIAITPGSAMINGPCRAVLCGTAGTLNGTDADGNTFAAIPLQVGYNPISLSAVATGGTAANLWALY